jgi:hypothetical protein
MTGYILEKIEDTFVNFLTSSFSASYSGSIPCAINMYTGVDDVDVESNNIIVYAAGFDEIEPGVELGIFNVGVGIRLNVPFYTTGSTDERNELVANLAYFATTGSLITDLINNSAGLNIFHVENTGHNPSFTSNGFVYTIDYRVVATIK